MRWRLGLILALNAVALIAARADEVALRNGDNITGTITRITPQAIDLSTDAAGPVHLKRDAVKAMLSTAAVPIVAADGAEHRAFLSPSEDWAGWHESPDAAAIAQSELAPPSRHALTVAMTLPHQNGQVVLGYLGSSTWALNKGSGQVPSIIDSLLKAQNPAAALTTVNGSISGARVGTYKPGQQSSSKLKADMQAQKGFKVLRLMIGSNDAAAGMPTAEWQQQMHAIIDDALAWPVDLIVLEEIGARTDKDTANELIRDYNAARQKLAGEKVLLGTAHTLQNQSDHLDTLSSDHIHQTDPGQNLLANTQAAEMTELFRPPAPTSMRSPATTSRSKVP